MEDDIDERGLVVDVEPSNIETMSLLVNGTVYTLTDTGSGGKVDLGPLHSLPLMNDEKADCSSTALEHVDQNIEVDTARGLVCMKVGDTIYQMPLCGIPAAGDATVSSQLLTSQDPTITSQATFIDVPAADQDTGTRTTVSENAADPTLTNFTKLVSVPPAKVSTSSAPSGSEPNKRRGGWPKGKRRKPEIRDKNAPKAPMTGYVIYAMERRKKVESENPSAFFPEITKMLGNEWSALPAAKKQKYLDEAEVDKKRYIEELKAYQQSDSYQNFMRRKKLNGLCTSVDAETSGDGVIDMEEDNGLYCKVCDKYFMSLHNKKEHMLGNKHLQAIKGEYELEQYKLSNKKSEVDLLLPTSHSTPLESISQTPGSSPEQKRDHSAVDVDSFVQDFFEKNMERESEIKALKQSLQIAKEKNIRCGKQVTELRDIDAKLQQDLATMKAYGTSLNAQIDMLKMVPTLFGVINF